ncbi:hypothetical protein ST37_12880 [Vibrio sp. qd031]|uniref:sensor domain-containing diguanylate cyclase n=1 Tax=Vibrio sp. qd031 TaxID=1603038 RepID=UPI000A1206A1|nr:diguanylate cyclase [Vibrio sp. qd031]ORT49309.1 hypothetical protein ST37_12880 [Vibrio sp. qd031]
MNDTVTYFRWFMRMMLILLIVVAVIIIEQMQYAAYQSNKQDKLNAATITLQSVSARFETLITNEILRASRLTNYIVVAQNTSQQHWQTLAESMLRDSQILRTVIIAPHDRVATVYPMANSQQYVGMRLPFSPSHWPGVLTAQVNQAPVLNGPMRTNMSSEVLILRLPVYLDPPENDLYWGGLSLELDWSALLEQAGVLALTDEYQIAIYSDDYGIDQKNPVYGELIDHSDASQEIYFPLNQWRIESRKNQTNLHWDIWNSYAKIRLIGYAILALLCIAFIMIYRLYKTANRQSLQDDLTQLPNRRYLMYTLNQLADHATRTNSVFTVLNIDLNKFKAINDSYGHSAGDKVLLAAANRLKSGLRGTDVVARVGGDEFIALIPRVGLESDVDIIINNLKDRLETEPIHLDENVKSEKQVTISCSFGYAIFNKDSKDIDVLLRKADEKMYQVKHQDPQ